MLILLYLTWHMTDFHKRPKNLNICVFVWNGSGMAGLDYPWDISKCQVNKLNLRNKVLHINYTNLKTNTGTNSVKPIWLFSSNIGTYPTFNSQNLSFANTLSQSCWTERTVKKFSSLPGETSDYDLELTWTKCKICWTCLFLSAGSFGFARLQYIHVFKITFT